MLFELLSHPTADTAASWHMQRHEMLISTSNLFTRPGYAGAACKGSSQVSLPYPKCGPAVGMFPSIWKHTEACRLPGSSWKHLFHAENAHTIPCMEKHFQVFLSNSSCYEISGCWANFAPPRPGAHSFVPVRMPFGCAE